MNINPISVIIGLGLLAFGIATAIDAGKFADDAFRRAGTKKLTWQLWPVLGGVLCGLVALIMGIIWFSSTKAKVAAAQMSGGMGAPPQSGPSSWGSPPPPPPQ